MYVCFYLQSMSSYFKRFLKGKNITIGFRSGIAKSKSKTKKLNETLRTESEMAQTRVG